MLGLLFPCTHPAALGDLTILLFKDTFDPFGIIFNRTKSRSITHASINNSITGQEVSHRGRIQLPIWNQGYNFNKNSHSYQKCVTLCVCYVTSVVSNSLQSYELQPARLLCPWDSLGKSIGMGCHALLRGSSQPRDRIHISFVSCIVRLVLYHQHHLGIPCYPM